MSEIIYQAEVIPPSKSELDERKQISEELEQERLEHIAKLDSAITKLKALGLTESEAKIIIGLE